MVVPELRGVQLEIMNDISSNPKTELKSGAPTRNPNARNMIAELAHVGEFQDFSKQERGKDP